MTGTLPQPKISDAQFKDATGKVDVEAWWSAFGAWDAAACAAAEAALAANPVSFEPLPYVGDCAYVDPVTGERSAWWSSEADAIAGSGPIDTSGMTPDEIATMEANGAAKAAERAAKAAKIAAKLAKQEAEAVAFWDAVERGDATYDPLAGKYQPKT